jgi:predicted DNA-binding transcriptional regulator AlpA
MQTEEFIRVPAAARLLEMSMSELYELIEQGRIPYSRENEHRMVTVRLSDIEAYRARAAI